MKKFVFTNEKYQAIKEKEYDRLKLDMKNIDKEIDKALGEQEALSEQFAAERARFDAACKKGVRPVELLRFQGFFELIREQREIVRQRLVKLTAEKQKLTEQLKRIHNELRVLEEMRTEQYQAYLKEVAAEEAKEMDEHISFTIFEKAV